MGNFWSFFRERTRPAPQVTLTLSQIDSGLINDFPEGGVKRDHLSLCLVMKLEVCSYHRRTRILYYQIRESGQPMWDKEVQEAESQNYSMICSESWLSSYDFLPQPKSCNDFYRVEPRSLGSPLNLSSPHTGADPGEPPSSSIQDKLTRGFIYLFTILMGFSVMTDHCLQEEVKSCSLLINKARLNLLFIINQ